MIQRRVLLKAGLASAAAIAAPHLAAKTGERVVIIGGGFGGATAARYLRQFNPALQVTLVEPASEFIMCPMSNRVIHGGLHLRDITRPYSRFVTNNGLRWVRARAEGIDLAAREVRAGAERLPYDRLIVAPGVDYVYDGIEGMGTQAQQARVPHAWKAGEQTQQLRSMLQAMPDDGVVAITIPKVPYRCPPGPYERASLIAHYLQTSKTKAKLMVFDANPEIQAKKGLFESVWKSRYSGRIEYVPNADLKGVDTQTGILEFDIQGKVKAHVINVIPPQRAGAIARSSGLTNVGNQWCGVDFLSYESVVAKGVYVLGDSIAGSPGMPKSGHMANQEAKVCAGAIAAQSMGMSVPTEPIIANTCYSFVSQNEVIHVAAVYRYDASKKIMVPAPGAGGVSAQPNTVEGLYAMAWATNIMNDTLG
ncbi:MAG: FCSD flavin-binding domain-containing protein [Hydrogenophaga sp.]|uniref:FCSD flavin-binding domain-containing protein n=1 Tax=Hydrogenophaga sp. TaxID=1904254 RepID=UPI0027700FFB|nr:FCSD flavin-binding domain-containing protein [Hydrogenophaga sp.]MDP2417041.1 FCSD flavin-binding domain-containing protein [Hydrogenophaga sp.]MDZ4187832.1 FCSD flavin-binding domain-containing protein [Hydrogenophaga sp.]